MPIEEGDQIKVSSEEGLKCVMSKDERTVTLIADDAELLHVAAMALAKTLDPGDDPYIPDYDRPIVVYTGAKFTRDEDDNFTYDVSSQFVQKFTQRPVGAKAAPAKEPGEAEPEPTDSLDINSVLEAVSNRVMLLLLQETEQANKQASKDEKETEEKT